MKTNSLSLSFVLCVFATRLAAQCSVDPVASFAILGNLTSICEGETIECDNRCDEVNPVACVDFMVWDWGDGTRDTVMNFNNHTHVYGYSTNAVCNGSIPINGKLYAIRLEIYYFDGSDHYNESPVRVRPKPRAFFSVQDTLCESDPFIHPTDQSCAAETYAWTFSTWPSGTVLGTSNEESPSFPSPGVGIYLLTETVNNTYCGSDNTAHQVVVVPSVVPMGSVMPTLLCAPGTAQLSAMGTLYANTLTWSISGSGWTYQSGGQHTQNATVLFTTPGDFTVTLTAEGCDEETITLGVVTVHASPNATMTGVQSGCPDTNGLLTIHPGLTGITNGGYPNLSYQWTFPGGNPASFTGQNPPPVTYASTGTYVVTCVITGDASDACGVHTLQQTLVVAQPATASASVSGVPAGGCAPFTVTLQNTSVNVDTFQWSILNGVQGVDWAFAGGTGPNSKNPQLTFLTAGAYTIHLQLPPIVNCYTVNSWEAPLLVHSVPVLQIDPTTASCVPANLNFSLALFNNGNDANTTVQWSFGNGTPAAGTGQSPPAVSFTQAGNVQVIATAQGNACGSASDTLLLSLITKTQVALQPYTDTLCRHDDPITLQTNIAAPGWPAQLPGGVFDPETAQAGLNSFVITNGTNDPDCITDTTAEIYVVDAMLTLACVPAFCDTLGTAALTGFSPTTNVVFSGDGVIDSLLGTISAAAAGFGSHIITMTYVEPDRGCLFTADCTFNVFQLPASGISGAPSEGCVDTPIDFAYTGSASGLTFEWRIDGGPIVSSGSSLSQPFSQTGDFTVWLIVDNGNCRDTAYHVIHIAAPLQLSLSVDSDSICAGVPVTVSVAVVGENPQWALYVGNYDTLPGFTTGTLSFPSGINDTIYTLKASGSNVCPENSASVDVYVRALAVAHLYPDTDTICSGDTICFHQLSTGLPLGGQVLYYGNGITDNSLPFSCMQYFAPDSMEVTVTAILQAFNTCNEDFDTVKMTIYPVQVKAFNEVNKTKLCTGEPLLVHNWSLPPTAPVYFNFGDNTGSYDSNPVKIYTNAGVYDFVQYVWDDCGGFDSLLRQITIIAGPPASFSWAPDTICAGMPTPFLFDASPDTTLLGFLWITDAGDTTAGSNPALAWEEPGWHTATLIVTDLTTGCATAVTRGVHIRANPEPILIASPRADCGSLTTVLDVTGVPPGYFFEWTLSNGFTAVNVPLTYTFDSSGLWSADLLVTDPWNCQAQASIDSLWVKPLPGSSFLPSIPYSCGAPVTVTLTNTTVDALGTAWYLDGQYLSNHTDTMLVLNEPGTYRIELVSENTWNCFDTARYYFTVYEPPVALAAVDSTGCEGETLTFSNMSQYANTFLWSFGDGAISTAEDTVHIYEISGWYPVSLIASIDHLCPDTFDLQVPVHVKTTPIAGFTVRDSILGQGYILVTDLSIGAAEWQYQLGGAVVSTEPEPVVQLTSNFDTVFIQTVYNDGCEASDTVIFYPTRFKTLVIPNALMPGAGDGEYVRFIPKGAGLLSFKLEIYAEWGELIWSTDRLNNGEPVESWDGNDRKGQPVPQGAYLWKVTAVFEDGEVWSGMPSKGRGGGQPRPFGTVTVIR